MMYMQQVESYPEGGLVEPPDDKVLRTSDGNTWICYRGTGVRFNVHPPIPGTGVWGIRWVEHAAIMGEQVQWVPCNVHKAVALLGLETKY